MGLFDDMIVNAKSAVDAVSKKAGKFVDVSKLRINEAELNKEIQKKFEQLGRVTYTSQKDGNSSENIVNKLSNEIDDLYNQLRTIMDQISLAKNKVKCPDCGYENFFESTFCSKCGAKLYIDVDDKENIEKD